MALYYLDTSAAFKLLAAEEHAETFLAFYREHRGDSWISSDLLADRGQPGRGAKLACADS
jgi:hypothetical protein